MTLNEELINKGEKQYFDFVEKIGLSSTIKTPVTNVLEDLGTMEPEDEEFKIASINLLFHEFFHVWTAEERT